MPVAVDTPPIRRAAAEAEFSGEAGLSAPIAWAGRLDPRETLDFIMDLSGLLDPQHDEEVVSWSAAASLEAAAAGVVIQSAPPFAPELVEDGRAMRIWVSVAPASRDSAAFAGEGLGVVLTASATTNTAAARDRFRSFLLTVCRK